jgi:hypothetical protein
MCARNISAVKALVDFGLEAGVDRREVEHGQRGELSEG